MFHVKHVGVDFVSFVSACGENSLTASRLLFPPQTLRWFASDWGTDLFSGVGGSSGLCLLFGQFLLDGVFELLETDTGSGDRTG